MKKNHIILSFDGGGIRGLIPAIWIAFLEKEIGYSIQQNVDMFAGTSTGSILAAAFAKKNPIASPIMVDLYENCGNEIFAESFWQRMKNPFGLFNAKYDINNLKKNLEKHLNNQRIRDCEKELLICSYDLEKRYNLLFTRQIAQKYSVWNIPLVEACASSSAALTYFKPNRFENENAIFTCVDGGICSLNNTSTMAVCELLNQGIAASHIQLISFGTGTQQAPYLYNDIKNSGIATLAKPIIEIEMDGASEAYDYATASILKPENYIRIQVNLTEETKEMDNIKPENIKRLRKLAETALIEQKYKFDKILEMLC
jgi:patatin-like phospholipase/acyl hydrolase